MLADIIAREYPYDSLNAPADDTLVCHLRIGDIVEQWHRRYANRSDAADSSVHQMLYGSQEHCSDSDIWLPLGDLNRGCYLHNLKYYEEQLARIPAAAGVKRVVLCAGSHQTPHTVHSHTVHLPSRCIC